MIQSRWLCWAAAGLLASCSGDDACAVPPALRALHPGTVAGGFGERCDAALRRFEAEGFSGAVLVARQGELVLHKGYGCDPADAERPITEQSAFWIASVSKQFTAAALLKLVEDGRLALSDPLARHLEGVPPDKQGIALEHLLHHTSGLGQSYAADGIADRAAAVRAVLRVPLQAAPGERFSYSNDGYTLLAAIVEIAAGQPFDAYLRARLLAPAGMNATGFWATEQASGVTGLAKRVPRELRGANWGCRGPTGLFSTTGDLYRWWNALQFGTVLAPAGRETLFRPAVATGGSLGSHACGWFFQPEFEGRPRLISPGSEDTGNNAVLAHFPQQDLLIIVLTHAGSRDEVPFSRVVLAELADLAP